tara:strand:- start:988 stop:1800 length:813 start_codon:yes stop_codon:yes gene_type:complete
MIIPNRPMAGFDKFNLPSPSPSTINEFVGYRSKWVLRKLFGYSFDSNCAMERGTATEKGLSPILQDLVTIEEGVQVALDYFDNKCNPNMKDYHEERATIPHLVRGAVKELKNKIGNLHTYQAKIEGVIQSYKYYGYTDFVMENTSTGKRTIVDLKTTKRTPYKLASSHARQIALYSNALECDAVLLYLIPHKKTDRKTKEVSYTTSGIWYELEDREKHLKEAHEIMQAMDIFLYNCNDKYEIAKLCYPNTDDFFWNDPKLIEARKKVWGV